MATPAKKPLHPTIDSDFVDNTYTNRPNSTLATPPAANKNYPPPRTSNVVVSLAEERTRRADKPTSRNIPRQRIVGNELQDLNPKLSPSLPNASDPAGAVAAHSSALFVSTLLGSLMGLMNIFASIAGIFTLIFLMAWAGMSADLSIESVKNAYNAAGIVGTAVFVAGETGITALKWVGFELPDIMAGFILFYIIQLILISTIYVVPLFIFHVLKIKPLGGKKALGKKLSWGFGFCVSLIPGMPIGIPLFLPWLFLVNKNPR